MSDIKVTITLEDGLAGCEITVDDKTALWEDLGKQQQIRICNSLANFYMLFYKCVKEEQDESKD